jgi:hypothetical protein
VLQKKEVIEETYCRNNEKSGHKIFRELVGMPNKISD